MTDPTPFDLVAICGANASGKTRLGVDLARRCAGEIISVDSRQVYRGLDIGSGKDLEEYETPDGPVPYHLIDICDPGEIYSLWHFVDDFSRVQYAKYIVAPGESSAMVREFLTEAWSGTDARQALVGIPEHLYCDHGSFRKSEEGQNFLASLNVELPPRMPYNSRASGKVERRHQTDWRRFELRFRLSPEASWKLEEVNELLAEHIVRENARAHPQIASATREEVYRASIAEHGVRRMPEDLARAIYRQEWRVLRMDRTVEWLGTWEVRDVLEEILGERVLCAKTADGRMVITDAKGRRYFAKPFEPIEAIEKWRGLRDEPGDKIDKSVALASFARIVPEGRGAARVVYANALLAGETAQVGGAFAARQQVYANKEAAKRALSEIMGAPFGALPEGARRSIDEALDQYELSAENIERIAALIEEASAG